MEMFSSFIASLYLIVSWDYLLFSIGAFVSFFLVSRHLKILASRLNTSAPKIQALMSKNFFLTVGSLIVLLIGILLMFYQVMNIESVFSPVDKPNAVHTLLGIHFYPDRVSHDIAPFRHFTLAFGLFFISLLLGSYYFLTLHALRETENEYLLATLNHKQALLEELNSTLEQRIETEVQNRQEKERILSNQARFAAMGEMIGNITHQWRQPLTAISNAVQDLPDAYAYGELDEVYLLKTVDQIHKQLTQMSSTIDDFRQFFSPSKIKMKFYAANQVKITLMMLQGMLQKHSIAVNLFINGDQEITGYPNEYNHVLINIINNARDVFKENTILNPTISITIDEQNGHSVVHIADNGGGIPSEILEKIFLPYFTTKGEIHGTGIGLYLSKQIIENNMGGTIQAANSDAGAVFTIRI